MMFSSSVDLSREVATTMKGRISALLSAALLSAGCAEMINHWPRQLDLTPPPRPHFESTAGKVTRHRVAVAQKKEPAETEKAVHSAAPASGGETSSSPAIGSSSPAELNGTMMTLGNDDVSKRRAERLLKDTDTRLNRINRANLSGEDASAYAQAVSFATRAREAMQHHDYTAASGFAEKASVLADKVAANTPP